ncbi:hypothetical protein B0H12DRAFT_43317 [Mycena haematopus]|nr:hypothetical protein B0H12DRAFT_43317 [Mycena haematopus]
MRVRTRPPNAALVILSERDGTGTKRRLSFFEASIESQHTLINSDNEESTEPSPKRSKTAYKPNTLGKVRNRDMHEAANSDYEEPTGPSRFPGTGGNGGSGTSRGIGGVGQGPSVQIDKFDGIQSFPGRARDHLFWVLDPVGEYIPVSLRYCHNYQDLDDHIKTSLRCSWKAWASYAERGDYSIVSEDGSFIKSQGFAQTVKAGMLLHISLPTRETANDYDMSHETGIGWG